MKIFQYWDGPNPPAEVATWIRGVAAGNPDFEHVLFDEQSAAAFIERHFGVRQAAAFKVCAVPAMQADVIRLCAILVHGGVYIDADNQSLRPLRELIDGAPYALMFTWMGMLNNGFLWFKEARNLFLQTCLDLTFDNIEARRFKTEFTSTGPGVFNALRALIDPETLPEVLHAFDNPTCKEWNFAELLEHVRATVEITPALCQSYKSITLMNALAASPWIGALQPAYKETSRHWLNWTAPIYRDA